jgi:ATP-dependent RNA helicase RhlE
VHDGQTCYVAAMSFSQLGLLPALQRAVAGEGYVEPTPIQARAIPHVLAGRDLLGLAQTGTGKTAAFALPILQRLSHIVPAGRQRPIRCLVLTPTRELAAQIQDSFATYGKHLALTSFVIFGGVGMDAQKQALRAGMDILVATPGRLLDLAGQGLLNLKALEVFVLDEADRMLDMGFIHDVRKVIRLLPPQRQTLFFSATMPREAQELADQLLTRPETVAVVPSATTADRVDQEVYFVEKADKRALLVDVLRDSAMRRVLVFSRTKHGANRIAEHLVKAGIGAEAIHGNKSQNARERALASFKSGKTRVLVATDIAARGIDIDDVTHVVNFDVPEVPETYVHRIGRTARAGAAGMALSFCEADERTDWRNIEKLTRQEIPIVEGHPYESAVPFTALTRAPAAAPAKPAKPAKSAKPAHATPPHQPHSHGRRDLPSAGNGKRRRRRGGRGSGPGSA